MNKIFLACGVAVLAAGANAAWVIDPTPGSLAGTENVLFNEPGLLATGPMVQGILNNSKALVSFFGAGEDLTTPPGGQARVTALDGGLTALSTAMTDPTLGIAAYQFDINSKANGSVTLDIIVLGSVVHTGTFGIKGGGSNWFRIYGTAGETMNQLDFSSTVDMMDVRQNRIGAAPAPVPEPSVIAGLGVGLAMLLRRRLKK